MQRWRELLNIRVNFIIVFIGAFLVIFLIKLTSLLPAQYYFNFSKLIGSDTSPFLVDPPSVNTTKLCAVLKKNRIDPGSIPTVGNCKKQPKPVADSLSKDQIDLVYELAFKTDTEIKSGFGQAAKTFQVQPMTEEAFDEILSQSGTPASAFTSIEYAVDKVISNHFEQMVGPQIASAFAGIRDPVIAPQIQQPAKQLSNNDIIKIKQAYLAFIAQFQNSHPDKTIIASIKKSYLDENIAAMYSSNSVQAIVYNYYLNQIKDPAIAKLRQTFEQKGLVWNEQKKKKILYEAVLKGGIANYGIAIAVRIIPVLLFGFVLGIIFGRYEFFSISLAGAFAAFLLSWPVILLWDTVVQSSWHEKKNIFLIFYLLYISAFFLTARVGAMFGILLHRTMPEALIIRPTTVGEASTISAISFKEISFNLIAGLLVNSVVYAFNLVIPLVG